MMKKRKRILSRIALFTVLTILVSVFDKADVKAIPGYNLTVAVDDDGGGDVAVTIDGEEPVGTNPYPVDENTPISIVATPSANYRFGEWIIESSTDFVFTGGGDNPTISFSMPADDVTITAHFVENEPDPSPTPDPGPTPPPEPPKDEEPDPTQTMEYFLNGVKDQANNLLKAIENDPATLNELKMKGLTIDAGVWHSFDEATCEKLDELIKLGIPVTIKCLGEEEDISIPANFKFRLKEMCDCNLYVGFEFIRTTVITGNMPPKVTPTPTPTPTPTVYNVTVTTDGHGEAYANKRSGVSGTKVMLKEVPDDGYRFKQWEVVSGGVELDNYRDYTTSFTIKSADVEIKAHFEKKEEYTRENDYGPEESKSEAAWTPEKAATTIAAEKAENQQTAGTQMAAAQAQLTTIATTKPTDEVINLDMTKIDILDRSTVNLLVLNNKFEYNIKIPVAGGLTTTVKIPANFNFRPFIKADGTMNIHEVLWSIILSKK